MTWTLTGRRCGKSINLGLEKSFFRLWGLRKRFPKIILCFFSTFVVRICTFCVSLSSTVPIVLPEVYINDFVESLRRRNRVLLCYFRICGSFTNSFAVTIFRKWGCSHFNVGQFANPRSSAAEDEVGGKLANPCSASAENQDGKFTYIGTSATENEVGCRLADPRSTTTENKGVQFANSGSSAAENEVGCRLADPRSATTENKGVQFANSGSSAAENEVGSQLADPRSSAAENQTCG